MEHLLSSVRRLRISLMKVKESKENLGQIIAEANLVKTALSSSLPVSWSAETEGEGEMGEEKVDFVSAAGYEMVELLIFAAQNLKDK